MDKYLVQQKCQEHGETIQAIDLKQINNEKAKYLCIKCILTKPLIKQNIQLINEVEVKLKEMKSNTFILQKKYLENNLEKFSSLQKKINEVQEQFNNQINISVKLINQKIQIIQDSLKNLVEPKLNSIDDKDLINLSQFKEKGCIINRDEENQQESELTNKLLQQIQFIQIQDKLYEITNDIENLFISNIDLQQKNQSLQKEKKKEKKRLKILNHFCKNHDSEFIMANLEPGKCEQRLYCVICIEKSQAKLTSLREVKKFWKIQRQNEQEAYLNFQTERQKKNTNIMEIIIDYKKRNQQQLSELIQLIKTQSVIIKREQQFQQINQDKKSIFSYELKEIEQIIDLLSCQDKMQTIKQQLNKKSLEDKAWLKELILKLSEMRQNINQTLESIEKYSLKEIESTESIQLYQKNLKFSTSLKNQQITVSHDGKVASSNQSQNLMCLCDQSIPKQTTVTIKLKIRQLGYIFIGVCLRNKIQQTYVFNDWGSIGHGTYFLCNDSYYCSHHDQKINRTPVGFTFTTNDIITMEVNQVKNIITWKNELKQQSFSSDLLDNQEYYVFVLLYKSEVELL